MSGKYLGTTSPSELLKNYSIHMALNPDHDTLKFKSFGITLGEHARTWYINLPKGSFESFANLKEKFLVQFAVRSQFEGQLKSCIRLFRVKVKL